MIDSKYIDMRNMKRFLYAVACLSLLLYGCDKDESGDIYTEGLSISIDTSEEIIIDPIGGTKTFTVVSGEELFISRDEDWFDVQLSKGGANYRMTSSTLKCSAGVYELTITVECPTALKNSTRRGNLTLASSDVSYTVKVAQDYPYLTFKGANETTLLWTWADKYGAGNNKKFDIESNVKWKIISSAAQRAATQNFVEQQSENGAVPTLSDMATRAVAMGWCNVSVSEGEGDGTFEIAPSDYNYEDEPFSDVITILVDSKTSLNNAIPPLRLVCTQTNLRFSIAQSAMGENVTIENNDYLLSSFMPCDAAPQTITVSSEANLNWRLSSANWTWLENSAGNKVQQGEGGTQLTFSVCAATNPYRSDREASITFNISSGGASATRTFKVKQDAFVHKVLDKNDLSMDNETSSIDNIGGESDALVVYVHSSGDWGLSCGYDTNNATEDWLSISSTGGAGDTERGETVNIYANTQNPEFRVRKATIRVDSEENDLTNSFVVAQEAFVFSASGTMSWRLGKQETDAKSVSLRSSGNWSATSSDDWLTVDTPSGSSSDATDVVFKASTNTGADERRATITLKSNYHEENSAYKTLYTPITIDVMQNGSFAVDKSGQTISFGAVDNLESEVKVECLAEGGWFITKKPEWITLSSTDSKLPEETVSITAAKSKSFSKRTGEIIFSMWDANVGAQKHRTVFVEQDAYVFEVTESLNGVEVPAYNTNDYTSYRVAINCSGKWSVVSYQNWVKFATSNSYSQATTNKLEDQTSSYLYIFVENTTTTSVRTLNITISCDGEEQGTKNPYKISATQKGYEWTVTPTSFTNIEAEKESGNITRSLAITCSGKWQIEKSTDWVSCKTSGTGNANVTLIIMPNPNQSSRTGSITVKSQDITYLTNTITINQKCVEFDLSPTELVFDAVPSEAKRIEIKSTGSWYYDSAQTKDVTIKTLTPNQGFGDKTVSILPEPNYTTLAIDYGKIVFKTTYGDFDEDVTIKMAAYRFDVDKREATPTESTIKLNCTGKWKVIRHADSTDVTWVDLDGISIGALQDGGENIDVKFMFKEQNLGTAERVAKFVIVCNDPVTDGYSKDLSRIEIVVKQPVSSTGN